MREGGGGGEGGREEEGGGGGGIKISSITLSLTLSLPYS